MCVCVCVCVCVSRPGQERGEGSLLDPARTSQKSGSSGSLSGRDLDSVSLASHSSSTDGARDTASLASSLNEPADSSHSLEDGPGLHGGSEHQLEGEVRLKSESEGTDGGHRSEKTSEKGQEVDSEKIGTPVGGPGQDNSATLLVDLSSPKLSHKSDEGDHKQLHSESSETAGQRLQAELLTSEKDKEQLSQQVEMTKRSPQEKDSEGVNYSVELSASDKLTALLQSSDSNVARIRYCAVCEK